MSKSILTKMTESNLRVSESSYKFYADKEVSLKQELDNTPKIFKNKRVKLQKKLKETKEKTDKYYDNFLEDISNLYDLNQEREEGTKND